MKQSMEQGTLLTGSIFGLLAALIWGAWPVLSRLALEQSLSGQDVTALRFGVSGLLLLPVVLINLKTRALLWKGLALAIGAGAPYVLLSTWGLKHAPSSHFGIISPSAMLLCSSLGSYLWLGDVMRRGRLLGLLLILGGILAVGFGSLATLNLGTLKGDIMFFGSGLLWGGYTLLCKKWGLSAWVATALVSVVSMVLYLPVYLWINGISLLALPLSEVTFQGFFQGVLAAIVALYCYSKAVGLLGSAKGALFAAMVPTIALLLGVLVLSESLDPIKILGVCLTTAGMLFALEIVIPSRFQRAEKQKMTEEIQPN